MRIRRKRQERTAAGRMPPANTPTVREAALAARVAELEAELRARNDFLAIAAHELRNPMTPISARLELLLAKARQTTEGAPAGLVQSLETLERLVNAYLRRATTLLDVARISGKLKLQTAEVDLSALVRQATANILPLAEGAGCQVRTAIDDGVTGRCDAMAVEQILENLLSNAIRYAPGSQSRSRLQKRGTPGDHLGAHRGGVDPTRNRKFESISLQRRDGMGQAAKEMAPSSLANN
jgi:two-component system, OmpR family, sensor kinase